MSVIASMSHGRAAETARSSDLTTKRLIAAEFLRHGSTRVLMVAVAGAAVARLVVGSWSLADLAAAAAVIAAIGITEWMIHLYLLHAPDDSFRMRVLQTGTGHREHHLDPNHVGWLMLGTVDALVFAPMIAGYIALMVVPLLWLTGSAVLAPYLSALTVAFLSLLHYEWTHLLVHSRYRPRTKYYARLARNHRLHHYRNERYWLGVTSNTGDRLLRSLPANKTDVPLSETARTLG